MPKVLNLNDAIADILTMLKRLIGEDIDLRWKPTESVWPVKMDTSQLDQLLANIIVNARDAITDVGKVTIETGNVTFDETYCEAHEGFKPGDFVMVTVSDNGIGMDKETLVNIFEPFFTTKDLGKGTGLGLSTVYGIIKQNNGFINVYSEPGQGSTFRIYIPRCHIVKDDGLEKTISETLPTGNETVLLVEDEPSILNLGKAMLERLGYTVLAANTPTDAIRLSQEYEGEIKLLMTDVVMPEMNGRDLTRQILSRYPKLKVLFMSGYTANVIAHHGVLDEGVQFIHKPFSKKDLANKVREALS
jgi:CheY-like chemotaxis protein